MPTRLINWFNTKLYYKVYRHADDADDECQHADRKHQHECQQVDRKHQHNTEKYRISYNFTWELNGLIYSLKDKI
ncbi:MAG: hypothetical protein ABI851_15060 [Saprospiraceae bacterium]